MKVTLFRDMEAEGWHSMDRYADNLARQLSIINFPFSTFETEPIISSPKVRMFWRDFIYPNIGRFFQGQVNHILDHSYAHLLNYLSPATTVVTCHDLIPLDFEEDPNVLSKFKKTVSYLNKAARIIAVSQRTKADLIERLGIEEGKIDVVYSGVEAVFHRFKKEEIKLGYRKKFGLPAGKIILNFGSNLRYKNVEAVLRVFREVLKSFPSAYLLRIHPLSMEQKKLASDLDISSNYLEIINPDDEDLAGLYNCGDVLLSPSLKEGFGLHVLEAMACGVPLVISKGTSLEEITGDYGIHVDPLDERQIVEATLWAINHTDVSSREGMVSRARNFSWQETARKTVGVYRKLNV